MFDKWKHDEEEQKRSSFVPDSDSDDEFEINVNKCHKCDVRFKEDEPDVYGCDHCPRWYHKRCLPASVLAIVEAEDVDLADVDVDCDYCSY